MTHNKADNAPMTFFAGIVIGGIFTALFTPRRGNELRRSISSRAESMHDGISDKVEEITEKTSANIDRAKNKLERVGSKTADKIDNPQDDK